MADGRHRPREPDGRHPGGAARGAGGADLVAATNSPLNERWRWYQWHGLGNILLGFYLPLVFLDTGDHLVLLVVTAIGGLSLGLMDVDLLAFQGEYTRGERIDRETT